MNTNPYIEDILNQPDELLRTLQTINLSSLAYIKKLIGIGQIDRIVITGMGASLHGIYPAWMLLSQSGLPAFWVDMAELAHYVRELITPNTLLWMISQSGRSAELMHFLEPSPLPKPKMILAITNDLTSPLAKAAAVTIPINTPAELTVSTRTYLNTLAISQLTALEITGQNTDIGFEELVNVSDNVKSYLKDWEAHLCTMMQLIGLPHNLVILGRGTSLAAVHTGSLIIGEASKFPTLPLNAAEFRHGPLELVNPNLSVMVFAGADATRTLNHHLAEDIVRLGGRAFWVASQKENNLDFIQMPYGAGLGLPIAEIIPLQILSLAFAKQMGLEAGKFYHSSKITLTE